MLTQIIQDSSPLPSPAALRAARLLAASAERRWGKFKDEKIKFLLGVLLSVAGDR